MLKREDRCLVHLVKYVRFVASLWETHLEHFHATIGITCLAYVCISRPNHDLVVLCVVEVTHQLSAIIFVHHYGTQDLTLSCGDNSTVPHRIRVNKQGDPDIDDLNCLLDGVLPEERSGMSTFFTSWAYSVLRMVPIDPRTGLLQSTYSARVSVPGYGMYVDLIVTTSGLHVNV